MLLLTCQKKNQEIVAKLLFGFHSEGLTTGKVNEIKSSYCFMVGVCRNEVMFQWEELIDIELYRSEYIWILVCT